MKKKYQNILVAVDGSEQSEQAFKEAVEIAERNESAIKILSVIDVSPWASLKAEFPQVTELIQHKIDEGIEVLDVKLKNHTKTRALKMEHEQLVGNPKLIIVDYAKNNNIDLGFVASKILRFLINLRKRWQQIL